MPAYPPHCSQPGCELLELITCALQLREQKQRASRGDLLKGTKLGGRGGGSLTNVRAEHPARRGDGDPRTANPKHQGQGSKGGGGAHGKCRAQSGPSKPHSRYRRVGSSPEAVTGLPVPL